MVNLVVSEGTEFASVSVDPGVVLYVDGSEAEAPFFWAMGERFAVRVERDGRCPNCGTPVWRATFSERSFNGPDAEFMDVSTITGETSVSNMPLIAGAFMGELVDGLSREDDVMIALFLRIETGATLLIDWVMALGDALYPLALPALQAWEAEHGGPDAYSESFSSIALEEV